jgi:Ca-activated chloride channel homolog
MRGRLVIIVLALAAVVIAFAASSDDPEEGTQPPRGRTPAAPAGDALHVTFPYSLEKEKLLAPLIKRFNAERRASGGRTVVVDASVVASGEVETKIAKGTLRPTMWSPAS